MRHKGYLVWMLAAGLCGAVLRGLSLLYGFESETGLPVSGYLPSMLLIGLTIAFPVISVLLCRSWFRVEQHEYEQLFGSLHGLPLVLSLLAAAGIIAAAGYGLLALPAEMLEEASVFGDQIIAPSALVVLLSALAWSLALASGVCLLALAIRNSRGKRAGQRTGLLTTLPILWGCADLIVVYHDHSANPVVAEYAYQLVLIVAVMLACRFIGGFLYDEGSEPRFFAAAGTAVYLALTNAGGMLIWKLQSNSDLSMMEYFGISTTIRTVLYFAAGLYLLAQAANALRVSPMPPEEKTATRVIT